MLADPFSFPADGLLAELDGEAGTPAVVGGLASGGQRPGDHCLFAGTDVLLEGAVAVALMGSATVTVVSQACMPIGPDMVVTASEGSSVLELAGIPGPRQARGGRQRPGSGRARAGGRRAAGRARDRREHARLRAGQLPRAPDPRRRPRLRACSCSARTPASARRCASTCATRAPPTRICAPPCARPAVRWASASPAGALMFSCNGRGTRMFDTPNHDAEAAAQELSDIPLAGSVLQRRDRPGARTQLPAWSHGDDGGVRRRLTIIRVHRRD